MSRIWTPIAAALFATAWLAVAVTSPSNAETFTACVHLDLNNVLYHVGLGTTPSKPCRPGDPAISWNQVGSEPLFLAVDCTAGDTVADALALAPSTTGRVTITLSGVCTESVSISRDDVTLRGASPGDGLQAPAETFAALTLDGAQRIVLSHLTLAGGSVGLAAQEGTAFRADDIHVHDATDSGVMVAGASARLENTTVEDNGGEGILAFNGARVTLVGGIVQNNGLLGVLVKGGSSAFIVRTDVLGNGQGGAMAWLGSGISLDGATVANNTGNGIIVVGGSSVLLGDSGVLVTEVSGNTGNGILVNDTSVIGAITLGSAVVKNNDLRGVFCEQAPAVAQITRHAVGFTLDATTVFGNTVGQIDCPGISVP